MDWDDARMFLAVARLGQVAAAARALGVNASTVSRRVTSLERRYRTTLVTRQANGCVLTAPGRRLAEAAARIENEFLSLQSQLAGPERGLSGTVRIGTPGALGNFILARQFGAFTDRHPDLVIQLVPLPRSFSLANREADIVITTDEPAAGNLIVEKLIDYTLSIYASDDYLRRTGPIRQLPDLADRLLVADIDDLFVNRVLPHNDLLKGVVARRFECASYSGKLEAVLGGVGVGVLHDYSALMHPSLHRVCPELCYQRTYWLSRRREPFNSQEVEATARFIAERLRAERERINRA